MFSVIFFSLLIYRLYLPGFYYDELLFVNAALNNDSSEMFLHKQFLGVPIFIFPYIGALKSWFYFFIFKIIDISYISLRMPMIIVGIISFLLNYFYVKKYISKSVAILFIILASFDISTIMSTRFDWGPTTFMMLFRILFLILLFKYWKSKKIKFLIYCFIVGSLGVFDKANFIWIINAGIFSLIFVNLISKDFKFKNYIFLIFLYLTLLVFFVSLYTNKVNILDHIDGNFTKEHLLTSFNLFINNIAGLNIIHMVCHSCDNLKISSFLSIFIICFSFLVLCMDLIKKNLSNEMLFLCIFFILIFFQVSITFPLGGHHLVVFSPLILILFSYSLLSFAKKINIYKIYFLSIVIIYYILSSIFVYFYYLENYESSYRTTFSPNIINYVENVTNNSSLSTVICIDWGLCTQMQALASNNDLKFHDLWPNFFHDGLTYDENEINYLYEKYLSDTNIAFVSFYNNFDDADSMLNESVSHKFFLHLAEKYQWEYLAIPFPADNPEYITFYKLR